MQNSDYRSDLKAIYVKRMNANQRYSVRAFARDCGLSAGFMSNVLNGRKHLSESKALQVSKKVFTKEIERKNFINRVRLASCNTKDQKEFLAKEVESSESASDINTIDRDKYELVSEWIHGLILEYSKIENLDRDGIRNLSKQSGVDAQKIEMAIERLKRLKLLKNNDSGVPEPTHAHVHLPSIPSEALIRYHKQVIAKSIDAFQNTNQDQRYFESSSLALDKDSYEKLQKKIVELQDFALALSDKCTDPDRIVQCNTQIFTILEK